MSAASMTPSLYLMPRTEVPVTIGRRVRSLVDAVTDEVDDAARVEDPPAERDRDIARIVRKRRKRGLSLEMVMLLILSLSLSLSLMLMLTIESESESVSQSI